MMTIYLRSFSGPAKVELRCGALLQGNLLPNCVRCGMSEVGLELEGDVTIFWQENGRYAGLSEHPFDVVKVEALPTEEPNLYDMWQKDLLKEPMWFRKGMDTVCPRLIRGSWCISDPSGWLFLSGFTEQALRKYRLIDGGDS